MLVALYQIEPTVPYRSNVTSLNRSVAKAGAVRTNYKDEMNELFLMWHIMDWGSYSVLISTVFRKASLKQTKLWTKAKRMLCWKPVFAEWQ